MSTAPPDPHPSSPHPSSPHPDDEPDRQPDHQPAQQAPVSVLAVLGLVLAFVFAPAGVVLSVLGLRETRGGARSGRGLAVAGVVVGSVITVLALVAAVLLLVSAASVARVVSESVTATAPPPPTAPSVPALPTASPTASATGPQVTDDITIVGCSADPASSSFSGVLSITNSADVPASYDIRFNGYTEDRQLTARASGEVTDLAPGETTEVSVTGATLDTTTPVSICRLEGTLRSTDTAG